MNTKIAITMSVIILGAIGLSLTFLPKELLGVINVTPTIHYQMVLQLLVGMYFAFAMLNWMSRGNIIGGIYNRPIAIANFTHFFMGSTIFIKIILRNPYSHYSLWALAVIYACFGVFFGLALFRHPAMINTDK